MEDTSCTINRYYDGDDIDLLMEASLDAMNDKYFEEKTKEQIREETLCTTQTSKAFV